MESPNRLAAAVKQIVDNYWRDNERPVLLSFLPKPLKEQLGDELYAELSKGKTLKEMIQETGPGYGYWLWEHPAQKAKLGVAPVGKSYSLENQHDDKPKKPIKHDKAATDQDIVLAFLKLLQKLPAQELEKVIIPASAITLLLNEK